MSVWNKTELFFLKIFGCACWPHHHPYNSRKLEFQSKQCVFLGYSSQHKGYKCLDPSIGCVYLSRDVIFDEDVFPFSGSTIKSYCPPTHETTSLPILSTLDSPTSDDHVINEATNLLSPNASVEFSGNFSLATMKVQPSTSSTGLSSSPSVVPTGLSLTPSAAQLPPNHTLSTGTAAPL